MGQRLSCALIYRSLDSPEGSRSSNGRISMRVSIRGFRRSTNAFSKRNSRTMQQPLRSGSSTKTSARVVSLPGWNRESLITFGALRNCATRCQMRRRSDKSLILKALGEKQHEDVKGPS